VLELPTLQVKEILEYAPVAVRVLVILGSQAFFLD
jgi:hypothetical protein